jgi:hypothetical protein
VPLIHKQTIQIIKDYKEFQKGLEKVQPAVPYEDAD